MANKSKKGGKSDDEPQRPAQSQSKQPGNQGEMTPQPISVRSGYVGSGKLEGKVAVVTGGDSGIGRSVAILFAREGADVAIVFLDESDDAAETKRLVESEGRRCFLCAGDIGDQAFCKSAISQTVQEFGRLDVLVNNAAEQHPKKEVSEITEAQLVSTFRTNIFSMFYLCDASIPHLKKQPGSCIINTTSVTAYRGSPGLLDYAATKGAIVSFTRSLSQNLVDDGIRVNAVAPGPIWTPLIPSTFPSKKVAKFGSDVPMGRAGEPHECGGCFVFLASDDASYMTGQVLHPNGGEIVNG